MFCGVSKESAAYTFKWTEGGGGLYLQNVSKHLPEYITSYTTVIFIMTTVRTSDVTY
jgi:hypothetical protein